MTFAHAAEAEHYPNALGSGYQSDRAPAPSTGWSTPRPRPRPHASGRNRRDSTARPWRRRAGRATRSLLRFSIRSRSRWRPLNRCRISASSDSTTSSGRSRTLRTRCSNRGCAERRRVLAGNVGPADDPPRVGLQDQRRAFDREPTHRGRCRGPRPGAGKVLKKVRRGTQAVKRGFLAARPGDSNPCRHR